MANPTHKSMGLVIAYVINASLSWWFYGYELGVFSTFQEHLSRVFGWTSSEKSVNVGLVTSTMAFGALLGSSISGKWANTFGRRGGMLLTNVICFIGIGLTMFVNLPVMLIGRIITGIGVGLHSSIEPVYINELSPTSLRGSMGALAQSVFASGLVISFVLALGLPDPSNTESNYWRFMFAFAGVPCVAQIISFFTWARFETPYYSLCVKGNEEEAKKVLDRIFKPEHVDAELRVLQLRKIRESRGGISFKDLFSVKYRRQLFVGCFIHFMQQAVGVNAITFYSNKILSGGDPQKEASVEVTLLTIAWGVAEYFAAYAALFTVERAGRKKLILIGCSVLLACLLGLSLSYFFDLTFPPKIILIVYMFFYGISLGPIAWLYAAEILPDKGFAMAAFVNWLSTVVVGQMTPIILDAIKAQGAFMIFFGTSAVGTIILTVSMHETKNMSAVQIFRRFSRIIENDDETANNKDNSNINNGDATTTTMQKIDVSAFERRSGDNNEDRDMVPSPAGGPLVMPDSAAAADNNSLK